MKEEIPRWNEVLRRETEMRRTCQVQVLVLITGAVVGLNMGPTHKMTLELDTCLRLHRWRSCEKLCKKRIIRYKISCSNARQMPSSSSNSTLRCVHLRENFACMRGVNCHSAQPCKECRDYIESRAILRCAVASRWIKAQGCARPRVVSKWLYKRSRSNRRPGGSTS